MQIAQLLFSQGFGSRRECAQLIRQGHVRVGGQTIDDPSAALTAQQLGPELTFEVRGESWTYQPQAHLMLHKPAGYECSRSPRHHPSVMSLLPEPVRRRGVQPVGRLDEDTTGLLLFSDDGKLIHRLTHPKWQVSKLYEVRTRHPLDDSVVQQLLDGVVLHDDPQPASAVAASINAPRLLHLVLSDGRYHQVKRMVAAVSNRVEALHRSRFGPLQLDPALQPGQWRWLTAAERLSLEPASASNPDGLKRT
jgi:16S rRNA pseudouridine516 synthase